MYAHTHRLQSTNSVSLVFAHTFICLLCSYVRSFDCLLLGLRTINCWHSANDSNGACQSDNTRVASPRFRCTYLALTLSLSLSLVRFAYNLFIHFNRIVYCFSLDHVHICTLYDYITIIVVVISFHVMICLFIFVRIDFVWVRLSEKLIYQIVLINWWKIVTISIDAVNPICPIYVCDEFNSHARTHSQLLQIKRI